MNSLTRKRRSRVAVKLRLDAPWYDRLVRIAQIRGMKVEDYAGACLKDALLDDESLYGGPDEYPFPPVPSAPIVSPFEC